MTPDEIKQLEARLTQMRAEVAAKAAQDVDFHDALKAEPQATLEKAYGLPAGTFNGVKIAIFEEPAGVLGFLIPPRSAPAGDELTEEQLEAVAGGSLLPTPPNGWSLSIGMPAGLMGGYNPITGQPYSGLSPLGPR